MSVTLVARLVLNLHRAGQPSNDGDTSLSTLAFQAREQENSILGNIGASLRFGSEGSEDDDELIEMSELQEQE